MTTDLTEHSYESLINLTSRFNRRLHSQKLARLPFLDNATGIAQRPCLLHRPNFERTAGFLTRIYQYPPYRWKKSKKPPPNPVICSREMWPGVSNGFLTNDGSVREVDDEDSRSTWAAGQDFDGESDTSEFLDETYGSRRKKKRSRIDRQGARMSRNFTSTNSSGRRRAQAYSNSTADEDTPDRYSSAAIFICDFCGVRYRSRTGLNYHLNSQHQNASRANPNLSSTQDDYQTTRSSTQSNGVISTGSTAHRASDSNEGASSSLIVKPDLQSTEGPARSKPTSDGASSSIVHSSAAPTQSEQKCDFCLGDAHLNKKTGLAEPMLRCSDCPRCAHFSCLQFTPNMITSVRTYRWQCIECKTCWLCGTSENDDQMLFCDDCDRGYHLYCLKPPLREPPEGSWSCQLCMDHFREASASYAQPTGEGAKPSASNRQFTSSQNPVSVGTTINGQS